MSPEWISASRWNTDELIDEAEIIEGFRFASLQDVLRYKIALSRPKDLADIAKIARYLDIDVSATPISDRLSSCSPMLVAAEGCVILPVGIERPRSTA